MKQLPLITLLATTVYGTEQEQPDFAAASPVTPVQPLTAEDLAKSWFTDNMYGNDNLAITEALASVPADQRESVLNLAKSLFTTYMNKYRKADIITAVASVQTAQRAAVVNFAKSLFITDMDGDHKQAIIKAVASVPDDQREAFVSFVISLFTGGMESCYRADIIKALASVPADQRAAFVKLAKSLFTTNISGYHKAEIIEALFSIPDDKRAAVVNLATSLFTDAMNGHRKASIIGVVAQIPTEQREARVLRAQNNIDLQPDNRRFNRRLIQLLELPLDQPIPPLIGGMAAVPGGYAYGINVHDINREDATTKAIELFIEHQKEIDTSLFKNAYTDFTEALDNLPKSTKKDNILRALGLVGERQADDFGGLLTGPITTCGAPNMNPQEFLGRLWHFSGTLESASETENAKHALFAGLADSIEDSGQVVCNPGKLQRMIIGVLQGRLEGVNIDGEGFVPDTALTDAMKATLDDNILIALKEEGAINKDKVLRLSSITKSGAKDYITARVKTIASLDTQGVLQNLYIKRDALSKAITLFLQNNPEIANDALLKGAFEHKMEAAFTLHQE
ncbi:MAG: hypothetical protein COY39_04785 [Alphaproteobacteria bacterium CG_4_10_14_0_8_um_filter_37_21]|nr:MAG: hypothetical protein COY39_04785 [Alphaproteobacteria bacterium CG_4_10_14_0_8_um_filter_37_21]